MYHFVAPWFPRPAYALKCSVYSGILMCSCAWFTTECRTATERQDDWSYSCLSGEHYQPRQVNAQTHGITCTDSVYRCSGAIAAQPAWQLANTPVWRDQKRPISLLYCCFVSFISTKARHWTYYSALHVICGCRAIYRLTVLRNHWHCCISYYHNIIISSGLPPVFLECTSYLFQLHAWV